MVHLVTGGGIIQESLGAIIPLQTGGFIGITGTLKMHGMAQAVGELTEQGSPAFGGRAADPLLQLLKAETADREVRSTAYQLKAAPLPELPRSRRLRLLPAAR